MPAISCTPDPRDPDPAVRMHSKQTVRLLVRCRPTGSVNQSSRGQPYPLQGDLTKHIIRQQSRWLGTESGWSLLRIGLLQMRIAEAKLIRIHSVRGDVP